MSYLNYPSVGPFQGHVDNVPSPHNPVNSFDEIVNWFCRKGRFHTRQKLNTTTSPPDGAQTRNVLSYLDAVNNWHTLYLTTQNAYAVTSGPTYHLMGYPVGVTNLAGNGLPFYPVVSANRVFFSNGSTQLLYANGEATLLDANANAAFRYLTINAQRVIGAYTTQPPAGILNSREFKQRVKWCVAGDPTNWTGLGSGQNDLIDIPDFITGLQTIGRNTLIWRSNGISVMTPTANSVLPFRFDNNSSSLTGIGTIYPYSLVAYDEFAAWVGPSDIYIINPGLSKQAIGGKAKKKIFTQLEQASGDVVRGMILDKLGPGIDFLSYWLSIPGPDVTWVYNFDEDSWVEFTGLSGNLTFTGEALFS